MTQRAIIESYSLFRGLEPPDALESLLFLVSEVGELCEAYLLTDPEGLTDSTELVLRQAENLGRLADAVVSARRLWVRNGDRHKAPSVPDEIGDVCMMLEKFASAQGLPEPFDCLLEKMAKKGYRSE